MLSLEEFFRTTYRPKRLRGASPRTIEDYGSVFRLTEEFLGRPWLLRELTDELVESYLGWLAAGGPSKGPHCGRSRLNRPRSTATRNKHLAYLLALWRAAREKKVRAVLGEEAPRDDPDVRKERAPKRIPEAWTPEEIATLIAIAELEPGTVGGVRAADWWPALFQTLYVTGWRIRTALQLTPAALEVFTAPLPCGAPACLRARGEVMKDHDDDRKPIDHATLDRLLRLGPATRERLFPCDVTPKTLRARMRKQLRLAGLSTRKWLFHKVRATHATALHAAGGNATASLGHSDPAVTAASYLDPRYLRQKSPIQLLPPLVIPTTPLRVAVG